MRSSRRLASGWRGPRSATPAPRTRAWARSSASASATMCARRSPSSKRPGARIVAGDPECRAADSGRRLPSAGAAADRRSLGNDAVHDCEPFGPVSTIMPYQDLARRHRAREPRQGQPGAVAVHPFARSGARVRAGRRRISRPHAGDQPRQCRGIDRPRLAAAGSGPRRPRPRRRKRGDGRCARREALHAAHRAPVLARDDRGDHRAICPWRSQAHHHVPIRSG